MESKKGQKSRLIIKYAKEHPEMTCYQIAKNLDVSPASVYNNIEPRGNKVRQSKREVVTTCLLQNPGLSATEVAKIVNVSINTVIKYANELKDEGKLS